MSRQHKPYTNKVVIMTKVKCEGCGEDAPSYEITHFGSMDECYRDLCSRCFNAEVVKLSGVENFDNTRLQPIGIADCDGVPHQFHFVRKLGYSQLHKSPHQLH